MAEGNSPMDGLNPDSVSSSSVAELTTADNGRTGVMGDNGHYTSPEVSATPIDVVVEKDNAIVSKLLANSLRHLAVKMNLAIREDGYVSVDELLASESFRHHNVTQSDIEEVVQRCPKQRFQLTVLPVSGDTTPADDDDHHRSEESLFIRATQGHSIRFIRDDLLLTRIETPAELPMCLHGTYHARLPAIQESGLNRMELNHIHMSPCEPEAILDSNSGGVQVQVLSGMRENSEIVIEIDVEAAMKAGIVFYRSINGVVLSRGLGDTGNIPSIYFKDIRKRPQHLIDAANNSAMLRRQQQQQQQRQEVLAGSAPPESSSSPK